MKQYTNIAHNSPKTGQRCDRNLDKEFWGETKGKPEWNMTCILCGFVKMVDNETFLKWQYCDCVI